MYNNNERVQGVYYVNPWVVGRGDWNAIKSHGDSFRYVKGTDKTMTFIYRIKNPKKKEFERITIVSSDRNQYKRKASEELADIS